MLCYNRVQINVVGRGKCGIPYKVYAIYSLAESCKPCLSIVCSFERRDLLLKLKTPNYA